MRYFIDGEIRKLKEQMIKDGYTDEEIEEEIKDYYKIVKSEVDKFNETYESD